MWKVDQILQLFAPFDCLGCQKEGALVCHDCQTLMPLPTRACYKCLRQAPSAACDDCKGQTELSAVWVASSYKAASVQLVGRLKFARTQAAASIIARIMDDRLPSFPSDTVVVHVPTATQRVRQRGYDQAQLIAHEVARFRELPYQPLLRRLGKTRQVGANRQERLRQLQTAYYCPRPQLVNGKRIILVDDVLTTGATIETAAKVLKSAGAVEVSAVLFAQKV